MKILARALCGAWLVVGTSGHAVFAAAATCESLRGFSSPGVTVTSAGAVAAGTFAQPGAAGRAGAPDAKAKTLPAFCRVAATLAPSADSNIGIEVWMPAANWNGKFQAVGNGGFSGSIGYSAMEDALARGYATASTDTGHVGGSASFAIGHPERLIDYGYRAVHEMTLTAKRVIAAYYTRAATHSYWNGCSAGGKQALKEAQRYPTDYDGIIAGAPAADWTGRASASLRVNVAMQKDAASAIPPAKYAMVHAAVLNACDALDGVKDGVLEDPTRCHFEPKTLECTGADAPDCLTSAQAETARVIYTPGVNAQTKRSITALSPGSEMGWATWGGPQPLSMALDHFMYLVFKDPTWNYRTFDFDKDAARAEDMDGDIINALEPNLRPFLGRGGKLLQYHGWADPQISPSASVQYYERVLAALGGPDAVSGSYRLFMVPGMAHCSGGDGPNRFDMVAALEQWVEQRVAPARIIASRPLTTGGQRTRPLCPYPQTAHYAGTGSTDDAANFACRRDN